jgi:hypothetical protein
MNIPIGSGFHKCFHQVLFPSMFSKVFPSTGVFPLLRPCHHCSFCLRWKHHGNIMEKLNPASRGSEGRKTKCFKPLRSPLPFKYSTGWSQPAIRQREAEINAAIETATGSGKKSKMAKMCSGGSTRSLSGVFQTPSRRPQC